MVILPMLTKVLIHMRIMTGEAVCFNEMNEVQVLVKASLAYRALTFNGQVLPRVNSFHPLLRMVKQGRHYKMNASPRLTAQD